MRMDTVAPALALTLLLAGCATGIAPRPAAEPLPGGLPALQASSTATLQPDLAIDRWWTLFGDADLDRLIEQALQRNHDLAIAAARLREARAQLDEVRAAQRPAAELQASSARSRRSADGLPPGADRTDSAHGVAVAGRYEIDLWGRLAAGTDAARQRLAAQQWARAAVQWSLTAQLAEAHFTLRAVQRQIEISDAVRDARAATVHLRRIEYQGGAAGEFELRRAEAELAGTDSSLVGLWRQRVSLESTLALLSGRPAAELGDAEAARTPLDPSHAFVARLPQGSAGELLQRRPDLREAEAQLAAAQADIAAARAATLPRLTLSGDAGSDVRSLSNLFSASGFVWSIAASATQSLIDGGALRSRVEQADARADAALAGYRQSVAAALLELREAYAVLDLAQQAQQAGRQRVVALQRAQRLAQQGVDAGALARIDLLDAERNAYQAQLDEVEAYRDRLLGQVAAFKALGGGYAAQDTTIR